MEQDENNSSKQNFWPAATTSAQLSVNMQSSSINDDNRLMLRSLQGNILNT